MSVVEAGDILAGLAALGIEHGAFIGTSRGGLIIHVLAAMRPTVLKAVVLNDIGPVHRRRRASRISAPISSGRRSRKTCAEAVAVQKAVHGAGIFRARPMRIGSAWSARIYREDGGRAGAGFRSGAAQRRQSDRPEPAVARAVAAVRSAWRPCRCWPSAAPTRNCFRPRRWTRWRSGIRIAKRSPSRARAMRRCWRPATCRDGSRRLSRALNGNQLTLSRKRRESRPSTCSEAATSTRWFTPHPPVGHLLPVQQGN